MRKHVNKERCTRIRFVKCNEVCLCSKPLLENIGHESAELSASTVKGKILLWSIRRKTARLEKCCSTMTVSAGIPK